MNLSPELVDMIAQIAIIVAGSTMTVVTGLINARLKKVSRIQIEEKYREDLHQAAQTWANNAVRRGIAAANAELVEDFYAYARQSIPEAVAKLRPNSSVITALLNRYLLKVTQR